MDGIKDHTLYLVIERSLGTSNLFFLNGYSAVYRFLSHGQSTVVRLLNFSPKSIDGYGNISNI